MLIKVGRRTEKRWGILFKCLTTRAVHLDLLVNMDVDSFLMSLRRFIARRGKPFELLSDQGTNFRGASKELQEAFTALTPDLRQQLAAEQIQFCFNPPSAPLWRVLGERGTICENRSAHHVGSADSVRGSAEDCLA